jgi:hypothetical protein
LTEPDQEGGIAETRTGQVSPPPSYIFASTRTRREIGARHRGRGLGIVLLLLLLFWAALGIGAAVLAGAMTL